MLDKLPASVRHLVILAMGWVISNGANWVTGLHLSPVEASGAGVLVSFLVLVFTPITKQYGVAKDQGGLVNIGSSTPSA